MKIAVLDDEEKAADTLIGYLKRYEQEASLMLDISVYDSAEKLLNKYDCSYKILFMDIEMAGINGLEAAKYIREKDESVVIVFITNMPQYAIHGYEVGAIDFILKPITYEKFMLKIDKVLRRLPEENTDSTVLRTSDGVISIPVSTVRYIEVNRNYLTYHTVSAQYKVRGTMADAEVKFSGPSFARISNSYIVNMKYITKIATMSVFVDDGELPMSRGKKPEFMQRYLRFMEKV